MVDVIATKWIITPPNIIAFISIKACSRGSKLEFAIRAFCLRFILAYVAVGRDSPTDPTPSSSFECVKRVIAASSRKRNISLLDSTSVMPLPKDITE